MLLSEHLYTHLILFYFFRVQKRAQSSEEDGEEKPGEAGGHRHALHQAEE